MKKAQYIPLGLHEGQIAAMQHISIRTTWLDRIFLVYISTDRRISLFVVAGRDGL